MTQAEADLHSLVRRLRTLVSRRAVMGADQEQVLQEVAAMVVAIAETPARDLDCCILKARALGDLEPLVPKLSVVSVLAQSLLADLAARQVSSPEHQAR